MRQKAVKVNDENGGGLAGSGSAGRGGDGWKTLATVLAIVLAAAVIIAVSMIIK